MQFIPPQLLTPARAAPAGDGWIHEVKYDGYRLQAHADGGRVRLFTRGGNDWTARLRGVASALAALGLDGACLDGELVAVGRDGLPDFDLLHRAMRGGRDAPRLVFHAFDLLRAGGRELLEMDVLARKAMLRERIGGGEDVRYVDHAVGGGPALWAQAQRLGIEGIVSKKAGSGYHPGQRVRWWLKVKCFHVYRFTVAARRPDGVAVVDDAGASAGTVPVYSARTLSLLSPGDVVEVKALAWRPGRKLRHATVVAPHVNLGAAA
jgi:bifunctional non-homologous end joining protein LigD